MNSIKCRIGQSLLALGLLIVSAGQAMAGVTVLSTDRFGYSGTYTEYSTLTNAQNGTNAIGSGTVDQRDLSLYFTNNAPSVYADANYINTAWYYTTTNQGYGVGNPNNTNLSFLQIANDPSNGYGPLIGSATGNFSDSSLDQYTITASGSNADGTNSAARFGDEGSANMAASATAGTFISYSLDATFSGLNPASYDSALGAYVSSGDPAGISVSGTFSAIFQNTSSTNPASNGFYVINLTLNDTSWAYANQGSLNASYPFQTSYFAASSAVPEPSSVVLMGMGALGALAQVWRRRRAA